MQIEQKIRAFIITNFLFNSQDTLFEADTPLLESGIIDSTGVTELVFFLKEEFGLTVPVEDLLPENFDTLSRLTDYVEKHLPA